MRHMAILLLSLTNACTSFGTAPPPDGEDGGAEEEEDALASDKLDAAPDQFYCLSDEGHNCSTFKCCAPMVCRPSLMGGGSTCQ